MFIHFTSRPAAEAIAASGTLELSRTIVGAVYAAAVGGTDVPGVQHDAAGHRDVAVVFDCDVPPDSTFPEETVWRRNEPLPIRPLAVITAAAAAALLDGTAAIPDDGLHRR